MKDKFITLKELLAINKDEKPSYGELLYVKEWRDFRKIILKRDEHQCQKCKKNGNQLAWWITGPYKIYVRQYSEIEKKYLGEDCEYSATHVELHVHHKYYINNHLPWEYLTDALITVCMECHENIHKIEKIPVYVNIEKDMELTTLTCNKCNGKGYLSEYNHFMRGICFSCDGAGFKIL